MFPAAVQGLCATAEKHLRHEARLCVDCTGSPSFFCFTLVKCSHAAHYHGRGTEAALSALPPRRGSELGGASRPSRPCCLPEGGVVALATRSAHEPNELENRAKSKAMARKRSSKESPSLLFGSLTKRSCNSGVVGI